MGSGVPNLLPPARSPGAPTMHVPGPPTGQAPAKTRRGLEEWWTGIVLALILGMALALRLYGFNWDNSAMIHPDERAVSGWVSRLAFPHNPLDLFNSSGSWNPGWDPVARAHDSSGFNYGSLPLYLIYFFSNLLNWLGGIFPWWADWKGATQDPQRILAGRALSAFADTITVFLVYRIGTRLAGTHTGLYAAALAAFAVLSIQLSHFTTVDIILTTFCTGAVLASIDLFTHGRNRDYIFCAIWLAAAIATKASAVPLISVVVVAHFWRQARVGDLARWRTFAMPVLSMIAGAIALFVFQPFTFLDWPTFWAGVQYQSDLARGTQTQFYTLKWAGTAPIIYPLQQLTYFSLGIPLAVIAFAGAILEGVRVFTAKRNAGALVACFVLVYFIAAGTLYMKYLRYMEPIVPSLCVLGAIFVAALTRGRVWFGGIWARVLGVGLGAVVLALTAGYGLAYDHIYSQPLTRIQATCWMFAHVPAGARIVQDGIDETLPVDGGLCPTPQPVYNLEPSLSTYDDDTLFKVQSMAATLSQADWYIITSRRSMDTFLPQPKKYPYTSRLYRLLFDPARPLGFTIEYRSNVVPSLGPWTLDESGANQNFNEYDHPPVWIFKNTGHLPSTALAAKITAGGAIAPPAVSAAPARSLMLSPSDIATNQHGPSYGQMFPPGSFAMQHPIIAWLVMLEALGLLTLPIAMRLFGRLADGGFLLAKTAGVLLLSYFSWIRASLHVAEYSQGEIALGLIPIGVISLLWGVRLNAIPRLLRARRVGVIVAEAAFLVGFAAFVYIRMLYPDMWHLISGGEKTMDFSFLNAIVRSRVMPPYDPWFSGGYLNYYYYGHFTVATLLKLVGITPAVAINLAIPTFFALALGTTVMLGLTLVRRIPFALLAGVFAVVSGNLVAGEVLVGDLQQAGPLSGKLHPVTVAGSNWFLIGGIINLISFSWSLVSGFVQGAFAALLGLVGVVLRQAELPSYAFNGGWPWDQTRVIDQNHVITEFPFWTFLFADPHAHMWDIPFALCALALAFTFVYRGAPDNDLSRSRLSLLPGGPVIAWPVMGIIVGAIGPTNLWDLATMLGAVALGLLTGFLLAGHSLPSALLGAAWRLALLAGLAFGLYLPFYVHFQSFESLGLTILRHQTPLGDFATMFGFFLFILVSYLLVAMLRETNLGLLVRRRVRFALFVLYYWDRRPELERYYRLAQCMAGASPRSAGVRRDIPGLTASLVGCGAVIFGLLVYRYVGVALIVSLFAALWIGTLVYDARGKTAFRRYPTLGRPTVITVWVAGLALAVLLLAHYLVLALLLTMIAAAVLLLLDQRTSRPRTVYCLHLLIIGGLAVAAMGEIVYVKDFYDADPLAFRDNTIFKLYEEAWLMMAVGSAGALARLAGFAGVLHAKPESVVTDPTPARGPGTDTAPFSHGLEARPGVTGSRLGVIRRAWLVGFILLFACVEVSPLRTTPLRVNERATWPLLQGSHIGPTLDGMAFVHYIYPDDYAAIQWLIANVSGSPVVLQSRAGGYRDFAARVTMFTGLPSVVNWGFEDGQQRYSGQPGPNGLPYPDQIGPRERDVDLIYDTLNTSVALQLLHRYNVTYIFVGHIERFGDPEVPDNLPPYTAAGLAKFQAMTAEDVLTRVYPPKGVPVTPSATIIYKVVK